MPTFAFWQSPIPWYRVLLEIPGYRSTVPRAPRIRWCCATTTSTSLGQGARYTTAAAMMIASAMDTHPISTPIAVF